MLAPTWVQVPGGNVVDISGKTIAASPAAAATVQQAANTATLAQAAAQGQILQPQQLIATPTQTQGPQGNNIVYSVQPAVVPQYQNVIIDGQETWLIPASNGQMFASANPTIITPAGQILRTQSNQGLGAAANLVQNIATVPMNQSQQTTAPSAATSVLNLAGIQNMVRPGAGGNIVQAVQLPSQLTAAAAPQIQQCWQQLPVQIPVSTANGQTVLQTIQIPIQTIQGGATMQTPLQAPMTAIFPQSISTVANNSPQTVTLTSASSNTQQLYNASGQEVSIATTSAMIPEASLDNQSSVTTQQQQSIITVPTPSSVSQQPISLPTLNIPSIGTTLTGIIPLMSQAVTSSPQQTLTTLPVQSLPQTVVSTTAASNQGSAPQQMQTVQTGQTTSSMAGMLAPGQIITNLQGLTGLQVQSSAPMAGQQQWVQTLNIPNIRQVTGSAQAQPTQNYQTIQLSGLQGLQSIQGLQALGLNQAQILNAPIIQNMASGATGAATATLQQTASSAATNGITISQLSPQIQTVQSVGGHVIQQASPAPASVTATQAQIVGEFIFSLENFKYICFFLFLF